MKLTSLGWAPHTKTRNRNCGRPKHPAASIPSLAWYFICTKRLNAYRPSEPLSNFNMSTTFSIKTYLGFKSFTMSIKTTIWRFLSSSSGDAVFLWRLYPLIPWQGGPPQITSTSPCNNFKQQFYLKYKSPLGFYQVCFINNATYRTRQYFWFHPFSHKILDAFLTLST